MERIGKGRCAIIGHLLSIGQGVYVPGYLNDEIDEAVILDCMTDILHYAHSRGMLTNSIQNAVKRKFESERTDQPGGKIE